MTIRNKEITLLSKVLIIGGGAAGMMAGIAAAENGGDVWIFEKNEKLGKKLFITGKGRCNLTNACTDETFFASVLTNPKFLFSAYHNFNREDVMTFFENAGVALKTERGNRVFPVSDHSSDIIRALEKTLKRAGARICLNKTVQEIRTRNGRFSSISLADGTEVFGDSCVIATGGLSYPVTGSTGDGYRFAESIGHTIIDTRPSLVSLLAEEPWVSDLMGLSLRNVKTSFYINGRQIHEEQGEMLFTRYGVSGPLILTASAVIGKYLPERKPLLLIDLKPALELPVLDKRLLREFEANRNKQFHNAVTSLFPAKLTPVIISLSKIAPERPVNSITKEERLEFAKLVKAFPLTIKALGGYNEAVITSGGVKISEVNPKTMESKKAPGVYFAGEVLDLDALTGGFNLQIAWSTAKAAGSSQYE